MTPYTHPDWAGFLAAVRAAPDDDLPRLVLADWLEENGQGERAELIRCQCDPLWAVPCEQVSYPLAGLAGQERYADIELECTTLMIGCEDVRPDWCRQCQLRHRAVRMLRGWDDDTTRHLPHPFAANGWTGFVVKSYERGMLHAVRGPLAVLSGGECGNCLRRRGGLRSTPAGTPCYDCGSADGQVGRTTGILRELVRREPVRTVVVTDREPRAGAFASGKAFYCWEHADDHSRYVDPQAALPGEVWDHLDGGTPERVVVRQDPDYQSCHQVVWFPTRDAATAALSAALIALAREDAPCPA